MPDPMPGRCASCRRTIWFDRDTLRWRDRVTVKGETLWGHAHFPCPKVVR